MKPRVLLDIDGVCGDFLTPCLEAVFQHTGKRFTPEDIGDWDIMKSLGIEGPDAKTIYESMQAPGLCLGIPVYPGAKEGVEELRKIAEVLAVTSPFGGNHWMHERDQWCIQNLGFHKDDVLHVRSSRKHVVSGDFLIEDKTSTLVEWCSHHPKGHGVLFRRSYNTRDGWEGTSANDWGGVVAAITALRP